MFGRAKILISFLQLQEGRNRNFKNEAIFYLIGSIFWPPLGLRWHTPFNASKSEIIGFGSHIEPLTINGQTIHPTSSIKFLGLTIQSNLNFQKHVDDISNKMRSAAGRLRTECRHLTLSDKRTVFNGWIRSLPTCNALAYLPHLNSSQLQQLNAAYNSGIRSIFKLPKKGYAPITELCERIRVPNIYQIKEYSILLEAWRRRSSFNVQLKGPTSRGRAKLNVPLPNTKGMAGKILSNILVE